MRVSSLLAVALMLTSLAVVPRPSLAQEGCIVELAPSAVVVGGQLLMSGSGFAPDVAPTVTYTYPGGEQLGFDLAEFPPSDRYRTDADGDFSPLDISFGPGPDEAIEDHVGEWQLALSDGNCTAETTFYQAATFDWTPVEVVAPTEDAYPTGVAVSVGGDVVIVGRRGQPAGVTEPRPIEALAWFSPDGESWQEVELPLASDRWARSVVWRDGGFAAAGVAPPPLRPGTPGSAVVWLSGDGQDWQQGTAPADIEGVGDMLAIDDQLVILGTAQGPRPKGKEWKQLPAQVQYPTWWTSSDGATWQGSRISKKPGYAVQGAPGMFPGAAAVAGCADDLCRSRSTVPVWLTEDGRAWQGSRAKTREGATPSRVASTAFGYYLRAGGQTWTSLDGRKWKPVPGLQDRDLAVGPFGHAGGVVMAVGDEGVSLSYDGESWVAYPDAAFVGSQIVDFAELPDGRIVVIGAEGVEPGPTSMKVWLGRPATPAVPTE